MASTVSDSNASMTLGICAAQDSRPCSSQSSRSDATEKICIAQAGDGASEASSENRSADAWFGFYAALMSLKPSSSSTSSTTTTEASLSEVGSSHGGQSPRPPVAWADVEVETVVPATSADATRAPNLSKAAVNLEVSTVQEDEPAQSETSLEPGLASPSGRSRRARRRRRTRGGGRGGGSMGMAGLEGFGPIDEEYALGAGVGRSRPGRDVVVLSDLCLGLDSPAMSGGCPSPSKLPSTQADFPGSPCRANSGPAGIMSTSLCNAVATMTATSPTDASARVPAPSPLLLSSPEVAWATPASPCRTRASPLGIVSTSPYTGPTTFAGEASTRSPPRCGAQHLGTASSQPAQSRLRAVAPNGIETTAATNAATDGSYSAMLSSPCRTRAAPTGGIVSTSPLMSQGPSSPDGAVTAGAGSRSADTLRSWLHASGLPSAADVMAQLQAAAPESYED